MPLPTHVLKEIARLMRDPDALRHERGRMPLPGRRGHYNPNQPRVPAGNSNGGQWTDTDGDTATSGQNDSERPQLAQFSPGRPPVRFPVTPSVRPPAAPPMRGPGLFGVLATLFAIWSARNTPEERTVFEFNAREYLKDPSGELVEANVDRLNREQVRNACPGLKEVQDRADEAARDVRRDGGWSMSNQQFGTAVHKRLKDLIDGDPATNLQAEVSRVKSEEETWTTAQRTQFVLMCLSALQRELYAYMISRPARAGAAALVRLECMSSRCMRSKPALLLNVLS
jgi:hypothetical protein